MRTLHIKPASEISMLLLIVIFFNVLNVVSILIYNTSWSELYTQLGFILIISGIAYGLFWIARILFALLKSS